MSINTKFAAIMQPKLAEVHERVISDPKENEVQVRICTCNICTSDYGQWVGTRNTRPFPMAGGHECAGIVVAKGPGVDDYLQIGDHVAMTVDFCGHCNPCKNGDTSLCENHERITQQEDGFWGKHWFATYANINYRFLIKMNPLLPMAQASFLEPISTVIHGIKRLNVKPGQNIVVVGAGTMGILNAQVARIYGANVIVSELLEKKLECARSLGFKTVNSKEEDIEEVVKEVTNGKGADAVILAVGLTFTTNQAFKLVRVGGSVLFFAAGYPEPEMDITPNQIHYKKLSLIGTFASDFKDFEEAANLLNTGIIDVSKLVEADYKLDDIQDAYEKAATVGSYRVAVHMHDDF